MKESTDIPFYFSWWHSKQGISSSFFLVHQYGKKFLSFYDTSAYYYEEEKIATVKARLRLVISLHIKSVSTKILRLLGYKHYVVLRLFCGQIFKLFEHYATRSLTRCVKSNMLSFGMW